jgi:hypothetical protein
MEIRQFGEEWPIFVVSDVGVTTRFARAKRDK